MPRLFTGLEIPSDVGKALATLRGGLPGARWIDPDNYHVTLRFIGDVDDVVAHEIASMLGRVRRQAFELRIEDLKSFGGRKPRQIVATLGPAQALMELQAEHDLSRYSRRDGLVNQLGCQSWLYLCQHSVWSFQFCSVIVERGLD